MKLNMSPIEQFAHEREHRISEYEKNIEWHNQTSSWITSSFEEMYMYNFEYMGRPIIQFPNDMIAIQELIWKVRPDLIIETGIAHGGSLIMSAASLALLDITDAIQSKSVLDPSEPKRLVLGIDIDIRKHNRDAILNHPMSNRIKMIEGSSIDLDTIEKVHEVAKEFNNILVILDSNHTHNHVVEELNAYASLVSVGSYCVVLDTIVEDLPDSIFPDRPWAKGDNPKTAVWQFLENNSDYIIDKTIQNKLKITVAPDGYLRRIS